VIRERAVTTFSWCWHCARLAAFVIGGIPFGYLAGRAACWAMTSVVMAVGTSARRMCSASAGLAEPVLTVLVLDALKGMLPGAWNSGGGIAAVRAG
jgi:glycerol-3-phosphate acyltransferase PlsY